MTQRVKLAPADPDVRITLGEGDNERTYRMVAITHEVEVKLAEAHDKILKLNAEGDSDFSDFLIKRAEAVCEQFDVLLKPADGKKKLAGEVLMDAYRDNQITFQAIEKLSQDLTEAGRPT